MNIGYHRIRPLQKVRLLLSIGSSATSADLTPTPLVYEFIFGLGTYELSRLEQALHAKVTGQDTLLEIEPGRWQAFFGHLKPPWIPDGIPDDRPLYLKASVADVRPAETREIIRAMAEQSHCGAGCSCGCGH
jgi:hypothetical protein